MSVQQRSRSRAIRGLIVAAALALGTALAPVAVAPAQAVGPSCPTWTNSGLKTLSWSTAYSNRGVALCEAFNDAGHAAISYKLQIIDLAGGASIEMWQNYYDWGTGLTGEERYTVKSIGTWGTQFGVQNTPANWGSFSATNAGFFTDVSGGPSGLSLPSKSGSANYGVAINGVDAAYNMPKRVLEIKWNGGSPQSVRVGTFPTYYTTGDVDSRLAWADQATVGLDPLYDITGGSQPSRLRTYYATDAALNTDGTKVYILSSTQNLTNSQANQILINSGAVTTIQMDGGASVQMGSFAGNVSTPGNRQIPQVIRVYYDNI